MTTLPIPRANPATMSEKAAMHVPVLDDLLITSGLHHLFAKDPAEWEARQAAYYAHIAQQERTIPPASSERSW